MRISQWYDRTVAYIGGRYADAGHRAAFGGNSGQRAAGSCLCTGTFCFYNLWFKVKVIGTRKKEPSIRVKFIARMDGQTRIDCLPSPQKDYVYATQTTAPELG